MYFGKDEQFSLGLRAFIRHEIGSCTTALIGKRNNVTVIVCMRNGFSCALTCGRGRIGCLIIMQYMMSCTSE